MVWDNLLKFQVYSPKFWLNDWLSTLPCQRLHFGDPSTCFGLNNNLQVLYETIDFVCYVTAWIWDFQDETCRHVEGSPYHIRTVEIFKYLLRHSKYVILVSEMYSYPNVRPPQHQSSEFIHSLNVLKVTKRTWFYREVSPKRVSQWVFSKGIKYGLAMKLNVCQKARKWKTWLCVNFVGVPQSLQLN